MGFFNKITAFLAERKEQKSKRNNAEHDKQVIKDALSAITIRRVKINGRVASAVVVDDVIVSLSDDGNDKGLAETCLTIRDMYFSTNGSKPTIELL